MNILLTLIYFNIFNLLLVLIYGLNWIWNMYRQNYSTYGAHYHLLFWARSLRISPRWISRGYSISESDSSVIYNLKYSLKCSFCKRPDGLIQWCGNTYPLLLVEDMIAFFLWDKNIQEECGKCVISTELCFLRNTWYFQIRRLSKMP